MRVAPANRSRPCRSVRCAQENRKKLIPNLCHPQGKPYPGVPGDFEAFLSSGQDTILLLGGTVFGGELRSALRAGEQHRSRLVLP